MLKNLNFCKNNIRYTDKTALIAHNNSGLQVLMNRLVNNSEIYD